MNTGDENSTLTSDIEGKGAYTVHTVKALCYEIRFKGHLDNHWAAWFHGCSLTREEDGTSRMIAPVVDQAELFGLINRVRDLSLTLISVNLVQPAASIERDKESSACSGQDRPAESAHNSIDREVR